MTLPDIQAIKSEWQTRFRLLDWAISIQYVDDLANPDGSPCWGLCQPFVDNRTAEIFICTPRDEAEAAKVVEVVIHEMLHVLVAVLTGRNREPASIGAEEQVVWTLTPLLKRLEGTSEGRTLARAVSRAFRRPPAPSRSGRRYHMDQTAMIAALRGILSAEGDAEAKLAMLSNVVAELEKAGSDAEPVSVTEPLAAQKDPAAPAAPLAQERDPMARAMNAVRSAIKEAIAPVTKRLDEAERTELFKQHGHKLTTEQRAALASAPLDTVRAFLAATPDSAPGRAARKTTPAQGGRGPAPEPAEDDELDERMGIRSRRPQGPVRLPEGGMRLHAMTPGEARRRILAGGQERS
ncbi:MULTISPECIES: hypothetical protein [Sorangium]|uniref:hypothetical protein n=1 Tax=Sorangium TaxID=39643 RepID=UPI003D9C2BFF